MAADRYCWARSAVFGAPTVSCPFSLRKFFSPRPRTFITSSIFLNGPFFCRYSMMRAAIFGPTPGRPSSSVADAVLMLIGPVAAGFAADARVLLCAAAGAACTATIMTRDAKVRIEHTMRTISLLLVGWMRIRRRLSQGIVQRGQKDDETAIDWWRAASRATAQLKP